MLNRPESYGIYESLRTYEGILFRAEEHLDRFFESAKTLGIKIPETRRELKAKLEKTFRESGLPDAFLRMTCADGKIFIVATRRTHAPEIYEKGIALKTAVNRRNPSSQMYPEAKSTACLNQVLATLDPAPPGNDEIIFLNTEGYVTEARIGNLFIVEHDPVLLKPLLLTPPARGLLDGVTRRFVIECARIGGISCEEMLLMRHDLFNAREAFLTNTSWEILPVREVDGRKTGSRIPGPVTCQLQKIFRQEVKKEIQKTHGSKNKTRSPQRLR